MVVVHVWRSRSRTISVASPSGARPAFRWAGAGCAPARPGSAAPAAAAPAAAPLAQAVFRAADLVYGPWTIALLLGIGLFLTVRFRLVQVRRFADAARSFVPAASEGAGALSPFQTFMTALAATIGTGNIAGVATAIVSGGPGALFWIWADGFIPTGIK